MKNLLLIVLLSASSFAVQSQCNEYFPIKDGAEWTYENFNAKGKTTGKNAQKVTEYAQVGEGFTATIQSTMFNDKDKEINKADLQISCANGVITMDMRKFIPEDQFKAFGSSEVKIDSKNLEFPSALSVGQKLKEGTITVTAVGSQIPMNMVVTISDRVVEAKETITSPAGTFECFKIKGKTHVKNQMGITINLEFGSIEWLAPKVGTIKSESYNKNGKLIGSTLLVDRKL